MDRKDLEKKLQSLEIPPPDEGKKEMIVQAALKEFEESRKDFAEESKGIDAGRRQRGKQGRFFPLKGGPLMTRPMFATISIVFVALFLGYSFVYYPGLTMRKDQFSVATYEGAGERSAQDVLVEADRKLVEGKEQGRLTKPSSIATQKQLKVQGKADNKRVDDLKAAIPQRVGSKKNTVDENVKKTFSAAVSEGRSDSPAEALMTSDVDAVARKVERKSKARKAGSTRDGFYLKGAAPLTEAVVGIGGKVAVLHEAESSLVRNEYAGRDRFERLSENRVKLSAETPVSTFSLDVDTASYAFVRRSLNQGHLPQKDAVRLEELINYFDYDYRLPESRTEPFRPTVAVYPTPWNKGTKLIHIGIKGHEVAKSERPRANLVFLLDVSGSMSSPDKLPLLKNSMKMLVGELSPEDTVAIAVYAGAAGTVLEPTSVKEKGKILAALDRLSSGGSTAGGAGIKLAYSLAEANFDKEAVNRVILATDGDFNVGIRNTDELKGFVERKRESGVYLSVLGFGQGNYNDQLMQTLAQNGNGNAAYIDTLSEARKVLVEEAGATLFTIAKDVKVQVEFNPDRVAEYRLIGYESRMLEREDFNNDRVDAGEVGAGHSVTAIYEITPVEKGQNLVDPLRYSQEAEKPKTDSSAEYAFLKIRYKLPDEAKSRLITMPISSDLEYRSVNAAPTDVRFAASVAAFGQLLKGSRYIGGFDYDDVRALAEPSRGRDRFGYRSEFLRLIGLASTASTMGDR